MSEWSFSNFNPAVITDNMGVVYPTLEHYYQAQKTLTLTGRMRIAALPTAGQAKKAGRALTVRGDWESTKLIVMREGLRQKYSSGSENAQILLDTGDEELVEWNYWHDVFWGICTCDTHALEGENRLGKLLMERREQLKVEI